MSEVPNENVEAPSDWTPEQLADSAAKAAKTNALFSNRIFIQPDGLHLRMTFGEQTGDNSIYHTSIVVPNSDALAYGQLIVRMAEAGIAQQAAFWRQQFAENGNENGE